MIVAGERLGLLLAAVAIAVTKDDLAGSVQLFGWVWLTALLLVSLMGFLVLARIDRRCNVFNTSISFRNMTKQIYASCDQFAITVADSIGMRLSGWVIYWLMGISPWCALFGYARQLAGYVYQAGIGVVLGIEGTAATASSDPRKFRKLVSESIRFQALILCPLVYTGSSMGLDLAKLWVGSEAESLLSGYASEFGHVLFCFSAGFGIKATVIGMVNAIVGVGLRAEYSKTFIATAILSFLSATAVAGGLPPRLAFIAMGYIFLFQNIAHASAVFRSSAARMAGIHFEAVVGWASIGILCTAIAAIAELSLCSYVGVCGGVAVLSRLAVFGFAYLVAIALWKRLIRCLSAPYKAVVGSS